jgi:hypothetical protein
MLDSVTPKRKSVLLHSFASVTPEETRNITSTGGLSNPQKQDRVTSVTDQRWSVAII